MILMPFAIPNKTKKNIWEFGSIFPKMPFYTSLQVPKTIILRIISQNWE
jgi:hypothetical protein